MPQRAYTMGGLAGTRPALKKKGIKYIAGMFAGHLAARQHKPCAPPHLSAAADLPGLSADQSACRILRVPLFSQNLI